MGEDKKKRKARARTRKKTRKMITQERKKLSRRKNKTQKSKIPVKTKKRKTKKRTTNRRKYSMKGGKKWRKGSIRKKKKVKTKGIGFLGLGNKNKPPSSGSENKKSFFSFGNGAKEAVVEKGQQEVKAAAAAEIDEQAKNVLSSVTHTDSEPDESEEKTITPDPVEKIPWYKKLF